MVPGGYIHQFYVNEARVFHSMHWLGQRLKDRIIRVSFSTGNKYSLPPFKLPKPAGDCGATKSPVHWKHEALPSQLKSLMREVHKSLRSDFHLHVT
jgi:hypothetical protein